MPGPGQSVFDLLPAARREHFLRLVDESGRIVLDPDSAMDGWGITVAADREWVRPRLRPFPVGALRDPLPPDPLPELPRTVRPLHGEARRGQLRRLRRRGRAPIRPGGSTRSTTGHDAMITAPEALAALLAA